MKKVILLFIAAVLLSSVCCSCRKLMCKCYATGYVSEDRLNEVLYKHIDDCVSIADSEPVVESGVTVTCSY